MSATSVVLAFLLLVGGLLGGASPALAADKQVQVWTNGYPLSVRESASTSARVIRTLPDKSYVTITCYVTGKTVSGLSARTSIWNKVSTGGYVSDGWLLTGSDNPVVPKCGSSTSTTTKAQRAVSWANSQVGSNSYYYLCERFVENAYGTSGRYPSAIAAYNALKAAGAVRTTGTPPAGALAFSKGPYDGDNGYLMISRGDGTYVSGGASGPSVQIFRTPNPGSTYLGWAPAPSSWPGR